MQNPNRKVAAINPLEELRRLLGTDEKPLHTSKLAALVDLAADTLRSIQTGRRSLTPDILKRLRRRGLDWNPQAKQWRFTYDHNAPLTLPLLQSFRHLAKGDAFFQGLDLDAVKARVTALLQQVDESAYHSLLLDLNDSLETLLETYAVDGAWKEFQMTALRFEFVKTRSGGQTLTKRFSGLLPPDSLLEGVESGTSLSAVQPAA
jgi:hypothetical protein